MKEKINFAITGGAGLIGSWVIDQIITEYGDQVGKITIIDNFSRGTMDNIQKALTHENVSLIEGDIRNLDTLNKALQNTDYVIHEAALRITQCAQEPRLCNDVLVNGTFNVLESCVQNKVKKLVFNSSASVYGDPDYLPMDEKHPFNNDTAYGAAKIANEAMAKAFRAMYGLNYICLRPFNVYGPRMDIFGVYTEVLIRWMDRIQQGLSPVIFGDGKQTLDFIYVGDMAKATVCAIKSKINEGTYNVGSGKETSLNELAGLLLKLTNSSLPIIHEPPRGVAHVNKRQADTSKALIDLEFKAQTTLEDGLKDLITWHKEKKNFK